MSQDRIIQLLNKYADHYGVDRRHVHAIATIESGHRQFREDGTILTSSAGALGVMQLMPSTARGLGVDPRDTEQNIKGGVRYFRQRLDLAGGDVNKAIAMYYAGIGNVQRNNAMEWEGVRRYQRNFHALLGQERVKNFSGIVVEASKDKDKEEGGSVLDKIKEAYEKLSDEDRRNLLVLCGVILVVVVIIIVK